MACFGDKYSALFVSVAALVAVLVFVSGVEGDYVYLEWNVSASLDRSPVSKDQPVITINGMFPGPLINCTTNDVIGVNVFNNLDEPLLITWNGIQQRLNSWQDGVSGTNCPIQPATNWTYEFQTKDQIGTFSYFPSINFLKAGGGFGPIRVNNRKVIKVPFPKPEREFDLLIGDWSTHSYKAVRESLSSKYGFLSTNFTCLLMNGKAPYSFPPTTDEYASFNVTRGKTYLFRISNVGSALSFNLRIDKHKLVLVETEGSYTNQITLDSLDIHVGQSYSVLLTTDNSISSYYIAATPTQTNIRVAGVGVLRYAGSTTLPTGPLPIGPDPSDPEFSLNQARSIRWNLTAGAARPNPQGMFNVSNVTTSQTFLLHNTRTQLLHNTHYTINNVSYYTPGTPLKLSDYLNNGSGIFYPDLYPTNFTERVALSGTFVASGTHKEWLEIVFFNDLEDMDTWHLDGFGLFVVGYGHGLWTPMSRLTYNVYDPVVRSSVQVYPTGWTAVYVYLDNPGMWNLRSERLESWFLGQEMYLRVTDYDPDPARERGPPQNLLYCGIYHSPPPPQPSGPTVTPPSQGLVPAAPAKSWSPSKRASSNVLLGVLLLWIVL
ncbi:hypothetical protein Syun_016353 [Stephania yunnanensis]|uniref:Monocopper oxidase-like protein SKU5 n=1 Tax=Stephania yunnanensis TaxID=152371 RepID=A0AAP0P4T7_9MAGN